MLIAAGLTVYGYLSTRLLMPVFLTLLYQGGHLRENYRGAYIPTSAGLGLLFVLLPVWAVMGWVAVAAGTMLVAMVGLLDDLWGTKAKGLRGHFRELRQGRLTTGALKAIAGLGVALLLSFFFGGEWLLLHTLLLALSINSINLLDLRPGRAGKLFLLLAVPLLLFMLFFTSGGYAAWFLAPVIGGMMAYLPLDLREKAMMGDAGSNFLGLILGVALLGLPIWPRILFIFGLVGLHWYTERYSLSVLVAQRPLLKRLDQWGRQPN